MVTYRRWSLLVMIGCLVAASPAPADVTVTNHASVGIVELYVSSADEDSWGENRLSQPIIAPGQSYRVSPLRAHGCQIDMRAIYANGTLEDKRGLDVCRVHQFRFDATAAISPGVSPAVSGSSTTSAERTVTVANHAARNIVELYVSPAASDDWGEDVLANHPISMGATQDVKAYVGCRADLRVVFDNRSAEERRDIDICAHPKLDIRPGWTTNDDLASAVGRAGEGVPS